VDHAQISPSSADRWTRCPGSVALSEKLKVELGITDTTSDAAQRGTDIHNYSADVWDGNIDMAEVPSDMQAEVADYLAQVKKYAKRFGDPNIEVELFAPRWANTWGTADAVFIKGKTMVILDLKTGRIPVVAEDNLQLLCYASLAREHYGIDPAKIILAIWQPNAGDGLPALREWTIKRAELDRYAAELKWAIERADSKVGRLTFFPGEKQCRWCPAAGHCKTQRRTSAILDFFDHQPPVQLLTPEEMSDLLDELPEVDTYIKALKTAAHELALAGHGPPRYKVVAGRSQRKWTNPDEVIDFLVDCEVPEEQYLEPGKLKSFTKLEKDEELAMFIKQFIIKPPGAPVLVPESDNRPPINPADDFDGAEEVDVEELV
jgi:hypothetical protein